MVFHLKLENRKGHPGNTANFIFGDLHVESRTMNATVSLTGSAAKDFQGLSSY
jgi:prepilin-type processing-associated H-X9-DG protein